jgi:hypothetical protein
LAQVLSVKLSAELRRPPASEVVQLVLARAHAFVFGDDGRTFAALSQPQRGAA